MTASESEIILQELYDRLDQAKNNGMDELHMAIDNYRDQHAVIVDAIVVFTGRVHQYAADYLQREQLVCKGFCQFLVGVISGEIKSHSAEGKKTSYAWETKSAGKECRL